MAQPGVRFADWEMQMKKIFCLIMLAMLAATLTVKAVAPPRGDERLRELVVYPQINLTFNFGIAFQCGEWMIIKTTDPDVQISGLRDELKQHPDDIERQLQLGHLLDNRGETNAAKACYQKAEQLCRNRTTARPQDGLALTELGRTLWQLDENDAAENFYRKAVLVSSNEWRCWVRLGNFLASEPFDAMFPQKLFGQYAPSPHLPAQEVLDYRPTPEALKRAEAARDEASRCFDRAMALAPREPEVFFQRAGFICWSNWQSCFFRHYRNGEQIDSVRWGSTFFSPETCVNLRKAAELNDRDYEFISLAAYFEWFKAMMQANLPANYSVKMMPEESQRSIRNAMTRLDALSKNSDPKLAAGALENHGILNLTFGDYTAASADFKRVVALDPASETSWDMLLGTMLSLKVSPEELVTVCQSRLNHKSSARNRLLLAKGLVLAGKWNEAAVQAEAAGRLEPDNILSPMLIAAIALKHSDQTNFLSVAAANLARADELLDKISEANEQKQRTCELGLNTIIFCVLNHRPDTARNIAIGYLKLFPDSDAAKEILRNLVEN